MRIAPDGAPATKLVLLSSVVVPLASGGKIDERRRPAERIGEAHDRAPVGETAESAEVRADRHARRNSVRFRADERDPQKFGERQRIGVDAFEKRHETSPSFEEA